MRTCVGCRRTASPDSLVRVVVRADGMLARGRYAPGRGAWLCARSPECLARAIRRRAFDRSFSRFFDNEVLEALGRELFGERWSAGREKRTAPSEGSEPLDVGG